MAALSAPRDTKQFSAGNVVPRRLVLKQKGSTTIYPGALVVINAGYAAPGTTATSLLAVGRAIGAASSSPGSNSAGGVSANAGADGAVSVEVEMGAFLFDNDAGDLLAQADVGKLCYITDDHTVCKTSTGKSVAGRVLGIDPVTSQIEVLSMLGLA